MIFRLLDFALRVVGSFFFVFLLQLQFKGQTLESYLNNFGKKFVVTKALNKVSQDGSKAVKNLLKEETEEEKKQKRETAKQKNQNRFDSFLQRINRPSGPKPKPKK